MAFASAKFSFFELVVLRVEFELDMCKLGATLSGLEQGQRLLDMIQGFFSPIATHFKRFLWRMVVGYLGLLSRPPAPKSSRNPLGSCAGETHDAHRDLRRLLELHLKPHGPLQEL